MIIHKVTLSENISLEICSIHKSHDHAQGIRTTW